MTLRPRTPAVYVRISSDPLGLRAGVERQRADCEALRQRLGWGEATVYEDNDISASKGLRRPAYEQMLADCEAGKRDGILVYSTDRLTRRLSELASFLDWRSSHGIPFATTEGDDTESANGRMVINIKGAVAQQEAERIAERVRRALEQAAAEGRPHGTGRRPFGYEEDRVTIREAEAAVVREAAARVVAGQSARSVALDLGRRGVPTVTGARWRDQTLRGVLTSPRIAGLRSHRGAVVGQGTWPAILSQAEWEAVCAALSPKFSRPPGWNARTHLLTGFARCGACGARLVGRAKHYLCAIDRNGCGKVARRADQVDGLVSELMMAYLDEHDLAAEPEPDEAAELTRQITDAEAAIARLYDSGLSDEDLFPLLRRRREQVNALRTDLQRIVRSTPAARPPSSGRASWEAADLAERRATLAAVVASVVVKPVGRGRRWDPSAIHVEWLAQQPAGDESPVTGPVPALAAP